MERFSRYLDTIISVVLDEPGVLLSHVEILPEDEKEMILNRFNDTRRDFPREKTIHQLFDEQAGRKESLDSTAVSALASDGSQREITYRDLKRNSDTLAAILMEKGAARGNIIAVMAVPSVEMVTAVLAVLKTGGSYLPLDPANPGERISYMLSDSQSSLLLRSPDIPVEHQLEFSGETITIDLAGLVSQSYSREIPVPSVEVASGDGVYTIYTSGTTGQAQRCPYQS